MKKMIFILAAIALMLTATNEMSAQGQRQGERVGQGQGQGQRMSFSERQARTLVMLTDSLDLSKTQVAAIKKVNTTYDAKFTSLREEMQNAEDRSAMRNKMRPLMDSYSKEVKAVLTEAQQVKYDVLQKNRRSNRSQRGANSTGTRAPRGQRARGTN